MGANRGPVFSKHQQLSSMLVSGCGTYIGLVTGQEVQIHMVAPPSLLRKYNVAQILQKHKRNNGYSTGKVSLEIQHLVWELAEKDTATKVAVYVHDATLHAILVFDLAENDPVIIEQDPLGVERFEWIRGNGEGAYKNCTQIAVFLKYSLELRVYSLDSTYVQFIIPKPALKRLAFRRDNKVWSIVLAPYYDKNLVSRSILSELANSPVILHFYNEGSTSRLLAALTLDFAPSHAASMLWSPSGKWLLLFDDADSISGYSLKVFNSLGIHTKKVKDLGNHKAQPTVAAKHHEGSHWLLLWVQMEELEHVVALPANVEQRLIVRVHGVTNLAFFTAEADLGAAWIYTNGKYRRGAASFSGKWKNALEFGSTVVLASDHLVAILEAKSDGVTLRLETRAVISAPQTYLSAHQLSSGMVLVFSDHVALYTSNTVEVKATSRFEFKGARVVLNAITVVENTPNGPVWRRIKLQMEDNDDSNLQIMRKYQYLEDNSKVVNLMRDVQHNEWSGKRKDDVTDTFQLNSKRRRSRFDQH